MNFTPDIIFKGLGFRKLPDGGACEHGCPAVTARFLAVPAGLPLDIADIFHGKGFVLKPAFHENIFKCGRYGRFIVPHAAGKIQWDHPSAYRQAASVQFNDRDNGPCLCLLQCSHRRMPGHPLQVRRA